MKELIKILLEDTLAALVMVGGIYGVSAVCGLLFRLLGCA